MHGRGYLCSVGTKPIWAEMKFLSTKVWLEKSYIWNQNKSAWMEGRNTHLDMLYTPLTPLIFSDSCRIVYIWYLDAGGVCRATICGLHQIFWCGWSDWTTLWRCWSLHRNSGETSRRICASHVCYVILLTIGHDCLSLHTGFWRTQGILCYKGPFINYHLGRVGKLAGGIHLIKVTLPRKYGKYKLPPPPKIA